MRADNIITLWHFDGETDGTTRHVFKNAYIRITNGISKSGIKEKGFHTSNTAAVRIPTTEKIEISTGDYICVGEDFCSVPDRSTALKVIEVRDNRRGSSPHWRILCGGSK